MHRNPLPSLAGFVYLIVALAPTLAAGDAVIHAGRLIDVRIRPAGAQVIDLSNFTVLPGLMDCHKHIAMHPMSPNRFEDLVTEMPPWWAPTGAAFRTAGSAREFAEMVCLGMAPMEALVSATRTAAELVGDQAEIGAIAPGVFADIVAVAGDPLADIHEMGKVKFAMKGWRGLREGRRSLTGEPYEALKFSAGLCDGRNIVRSICAGRGDRHYPPQGYGRGNDAGVYCQGWPPANPR